MHLHRATLWLALAVMAALPARADEPAQPGNAAIHYWCAAAVLNHPTNDQEEKVLDYIESWCSLPPKVFVERREAVSFLQDDLWPGRAMTILHIGAECPQCDFDTDRLLGDFPIVQLGALRNLARRGWAATAMLEGQGDMLRAAQLHSALLQFSAHLCQCPQSLYAMTGGALLDATLAHAGAFEVRKPGPEALRALMDRLNRIPPNPLSFTHYWNYQAKFQPPQLKKLQPMSDKELDEALGSVTEYDLTMFRDGFGPEWKTVFQFLRSKKPEERQGQIESWAKQLGEELNAVAKAGDAPPAESEPRVRAQVERMQRLYSKPADGHSPPEDPFLVMWTSLASATYADFARYNANLEMGRILCAAALCEAETDRYPASLDALARYFPAGLPKDPFTGKDFLYALEEGLPCVTAQPSASLRQELKAWDCRMSMAQTLKWQAERVERYRKELQSPTPGAHD